MKNLNAKNKTNPEKWVCEDGKTLRAGDRSINIWWTVENEEQQDAIVEMMKRFTASQCKAMFEAGL